VIDPRTRVLAIAASVALLLGVLELLRRRRLKEEYSVLWTLTAVTLLVLSIFPDLLMTATKGIGAVLASSTLFLTALVFAMLMLLHFSVRISVLERGFTSLVQELGLMAVERDSLREELEESRDRRGGSG
jgi:hypothetical protein